MNPNFEWKEQNSLSLKFNWPAGYDWCRFSSRGNGQFYRQRGWPETMYRMPVKPRLVGASARLVHSLRRCKARVRNGAELCAIKALRVALASTRKITLTINKNHRLSAKSLEPVGRASTASWGETAFPQDFPLELAKFRLVRPIVQPWALTPSEVPPHYSHSTEPDQSRAYARKNSNGCFFVFAEKRCAAFVSCCSRKHCSFLEVHDNQDESDKLPSPFFLDSFKLRC